METGTDMKLKETLKRVFGYDTFRGTQEQIIQHVMDGKNTFVIMPTGAGKSLCYQLPAITKEGTAIVISPLIALMKNQVDQMNAVGINARFLNSTLSKSEMTRVKKETLSGEVKLLYVAPESLTKESNVEFLKKSRISFVAVDEAHCISEWGHDFRPEYRRIKAIIKDLGDVPIVALTATATPKVQLDIMKNLEMENASVFQSSFNRTNLMYEVKPKKQAKKQLIKLVKEHKGESGIIYCLSRKKVEEIAEFLKVNGVNVAPYHAGMDSAVRMRNQDAFLNEDVDVVVATIAFGMGIDKPDVRYVVHYDAPKSIEGYYQETGRAGRDGIMSKVVMFYSYNDILKLEKFNKDKSVTERENAKYLLEEMALYAESAVCRRKQLLHYFGEEWHKENCEACDNCLHPRERFDGEELVTKVIEAVRQTEERFNLNHISNVLVGKKTEHVLSYSHDKLKIFGAGKDHDEHFWKSIIRQTLLNEFIAKDIENPGVFKLAQKGIDFLIDPFKVELVKDHEYETEGEEEEIEKETINTTAYDKVLFDMIKALRKKVAKEKGLPPYVIFQDPSMEEMATMYPTTIDDLIKIVGVGESKARKFGRPFLKLIEKYVEENDILTASDVLVKSAGVKSKNKIFIIQQIDRQIDLEEIAEAKEMKYENLIKEIENICYGGTKLNLDYYIDQLLDDDRQDDIYDYFLNAETDSIAEAMEELGEFYSEDEVRLMRIKFMSEYAH
ncbi:DNA helicase RecQ [Marinoscillum furvescens]|uniref:DNA helicase RecQ n=1 Tax=Marinoscillum furvescens DSM 4134 TaxID=1122208 RepID=A0A3D9L5L7_MARFU|nr:DNA helicase RecQ [Marinoscillum furvescens]RED99722.1 ATP-dependent DNA helicase RecQ [Marinoscillum furvescens DSM 4134]